MSDRFRIHGPGPGPVDVPVAGVLVAASIAYVLSDLRREVPADMIAESAPFAGFCITVEGLADRRRVRANLLVGWEGAAATVGQLRRWLDALPTGLRDQAAAAEAYRKADDAYRPR